MNTTTSVVATAAIVTAGRWSEGKGIELKVAIGATTLGIFLAVLDSANEQFASQLALLVLIVALFRYVPSIVYGKRSQGGNFGGTF